MANPFYRNSHALIIGINTYKYSSPLGYAVNDAKELSELLISQFDFDKSNVTLLLNEQATHQSIIERYLDYAIDGTDEDDRILIFFAGHGLTTKSRRHEVGFLVPYDGNPDVISSLIRWDELTRNADLIPAKHMLFIMDACYGGLAITRTLKPGAVRFLDDMLIRPCRQVLAAGKADEVVADLGGPREGHSVFTGHLLEGLEGKAHDGSKVLTANGLMAYVYQMVGQDKDSNQTPHYGYFDGDGDFVFLPKKDEASIVDATKNDDTLISVPAVSPDSGANMEISNSRRIKELLADDKFTILLHDAIVDQTRQFISLSDNDKYSTQIDWSPQELINRVNSYEEDSKTLCESQMLVSYWGNDTHQEIINLPLQRIANRLKIAAGTIAWINLRWYPELLLFYSSGISSCARNQYSNLAALFQNRVINPEYMDKTLSVVTAIGTKYFELSNLFKNLQGYEKKHTPVSEYLFQHLQPTFDDLFFLSEEYESHFDKFEVLFALEFAENFSRENDREVFGPFGRFAWKFTSRLGGGPLKAIMLEAERLKNDWPPIKAGLFRGSIERFNEVAKQFEERLARLGWL